MRKKELLFTLVLCMIFLAGCQCRHEWIEADCVTPKTCSKCGETEGEALGHRNSSFEKTYDITNATVTTERYCMTCLERLVSTSEPLTTFIKDDQFIFTPQQFLDRLVNIAKVTYPECGYVVADAYDQLCAAVYWENDYTTDYTITFYHSDDTPITIEEIDSHGIWYAVIVHEEPVKDYIAKLGTENDEAVLHIFCKAIDPAYDADTYSSIYYGKLIGFQSAVESNEPSTYAEINNMVYDFYFSGSSEKRTIWESLTIIASNPYSE